MALGVPFLIVSMVLSASVAASAQGRPAPDATAGSDAAGPALDCRVSEIEPDASSRSSRSAVETRTDDRRQAQEALARQHFVVGEVQRALDIWNDVGKPHVHCVNVDGLVRTPRSVVIDYLGISSGELLTAEKFRRTQRRLDELPIAVRSTLRYDPNENGSATVTPIVTERRVVPNGAKGWTLVGIRAVLQEEIRFDVSGPTGRADVWSPAYRWSGNRPRVMLRLDTPAPGKIPGVLRFQTFLERQTYRHETLGDGVFSERRERVGAALSDWVTSWLRWEAGAAFDRIAGVPYVAAEGSLNARALGDRLAVVLTAGRWAAANHGLPFANGELVATVRSTPKQDVPVLTSLVGVALTSDAAPLAIWPAASSGEGRGALLRAHPLRRGRVITGDVFGRQLVFATSEYEYPVSTRAGMVGLAGFVDLARASRRLDPRSSSALHVDVGAGVRFSASGSSKVRLDVGYGVRDGRVRLSAGYVVPWGRR